jgi:hypothetical protein
VKRIRSRTTDRVCGLCDAILCPPCSKPDAAAPEARTLRTNLPNPDRSRCDAERRFGLRWEPVTRTRGAGLCVAPSWEAGSRLLRARSVRPGGPTCDRGDHAEFPGTDLARSSADPELR